MQKKDPVGSFGKARGGTIVNKPKREREGLELRKKMGGR